ncbi:MAG: hypothetical protein Q9199_005222 [Rusavskia elegans]
MTPNLLPDHAEYSGTTQHVSVEEHVNPTYGPLEPIAIVVNSFGFEGSNSHVVIDDAYNYLRLHKLIGNHNSVVKPPKLEKGNWLTSHSITSLERLNTTGLDLLTNDKQSNVDYTAATHHEDPADEGPRARLLVWSASGLRRLATAYNEYFGDVSRSGPFSRDPNLLGDLAYTLANRRTTIPWRGFTIVGTASFFLFNGCFFSRAQRYSNRLLIAYIFTGQGAQYSEMGKEPLVYPQFLQTLKAAEQILLDLGCQWSLVDELMKPTNVSWVNEPVISQPLGTALQVALVELLKAFGLIPVAVMGHSSGEIAAA